MASLKEHWFIVKTAEVMDVIRAFIRVSLM